MKLVDIREIVVPIKSNIRNSYIDFSQMTVSVLAAITDVIRDGKRVVGFGFNSNGRYAPSGLLRDRFIPRLKAAEPTSLLNDAGENFDPFKIWNVLMRNEKPGGHGERSVAVGVFDMATAIAYAHALKPYGLRWYEEAGDPLDYELQAKLAGHYQGPMATGENLFSVQDARNLIRYAGMRNDRDVLQFDCALSYGLVEYMRILDMLKEYGWSARRCIPHGGHQLSLHIAAGLGLGGNESYPGIFQPFGGFADDTPVEDGYVSLPDIPGIGFESKKELFRLLKTLSDN